MSESDLLNVRRLAAIDMHGARGTGRRRRVIVAQFILSAVVMTGFGFWLTAAAESPGAAAFGLWTAGAGLNYVPLAAYALALSRSGRLQAELAGVDIAREARRYGLRQLWILVPLSLVAIAACDRPTRRGQGPAA